MEKVEQRAKETGIFYLALWSNVLFVSLTWTHKHLQMLYGE